MLIIAGHGATLYSIVCIETSLGIICGCLPACKPLMSRILPRVFASTNASHPSRQKKASKMDGASFPFQSLSGGIVKSEGYTVEYDDGRSEAGQAKSAADVDARSAGSEEWIIMQDNPRDLAGQRVKSGV
jgi:hypothetical protein